MPAIRISPTALKKLQKICDELPGAELEPWYDHFNLKVGKKSFASQLNDHHGDGRVALWCKATRETQSLLVDLDPERFFIPPYMGHHGWIGVRLEGKPEWSMVKRLVEDAWLLAAPKKLIAMRKTVSEQPATTARDRRATGSDKLLKRRRRL